MLSAGSFSSPYEHLSQPETKRMVEHYTAYLSDNTRLIANPGLKVRQPRVHSEPSPLFLSRPEKANKSLRPSPPTSPTCFWQSGCIPVPRGAEGGFRV